jgi:prepilin-type N-terminal cleavage/methylation domain-containing protein
LDKKVLRKMIFIREEQGFTLIELLIVVAIIAILAAIAIPNFLAAQVRSKVSRVRAELKTVATGLESYNVDENMYPKTAPTTTAGGSAGIPVVLTTPVAYLTNVKGLVDPFLQPGRTSSESGTIGEKTWYTYHNVREYQLAQGNNHTGAAGFWNPAPGNFGAPEAYGDWRTLSVGPDGLYYNMKPLPVPDNKRWRMTMEYDPTNGVSSFGNIFRSQKHSEPFEWRGNDPAYWTDPGL